MKDKNEFPKTLKAALAHFANPDTALQFAVSMRWPNGVKCPRCGSVHVSFTAKRRVWTCEDCPNRRQFSFKVGTIMEDSPIGLDKWLIGMWLIASAKNGISSYELHRALGITQKSAWFLGHRIRLALQSGTVEKLSGEVEADETLIGGLARNMHTSRNKRRGRGTGGIGKEIVMGFLERGGKVKAKHLPNVKRETLHNEVRQNVEPGSHVFTDQWTGYIGLRRGGYIHKVINHVRAYVRGNVHTNGIENFWCLLKRCFKGTYVSVEPFHLFRYLDEEVFRFNNREDDDGARFVKAVSGVTGRRLTYQTLIGNVSISGRAEAP